MCKSAFYISPICSSVHLASKSGPVVMETVCVQSALSTRFTVFTTHLSLSVCSTLHPATSSPLGAYETKAGGANYAKRDANQCQDPWCMTGWQWTCVFYCILLNGVWLFLFIHYSKNKIKNKNILFYIIFISHCWQCLQTPKCNMCAKLKDDLKSWPGTLQRRVGRAARVCGLQPVIDSTRFVPQFIHLLVAHTGVCSVVTQSLHRRVCMCIFVFCRAFTTKYFHVNTWDGGVCPTPLTTVCWSPPH